MQRPEGKQPSGAFAAGEPSGHRGAAELGGRRRPCLSADGSVSARWPPSRAATEGPRCSLDGAPGDLAEELREFDAVLDAFSPGAQERRFPGEEPPERRRSDGGGSDAAQRESLFRCDAQGADSPYRNSFGFSDGKLNSPALSPPAVSTPTIASRKGKLGDTKELEDFIADLDRTLASM
ncbi:regulator of cell cycle RGCC [Zootoca vivipara]|uniref:regulator of cell cycle RGCC n=1 Tax=Zootoca vivipara TaxID=8524 RepID=UPI00293BB339|nr:regulator of cell cycle RGCC [Zootoca vivipara]